MALEQCKEGMEYPAPTVTQKIRAWFKVRDRGDKGVFITLLKKQSFMHTGTLPQSARHALLQPPPYYFYIALVVLLILETLGVVGSLYYAQSVRNSNIDAATNIALSSARDLEKLMDDQKGPILQVATAVAMVS